MANYDGPYAAELRVALEIAALAGQMITTASRERWQSTSTAAQGSGQEPGTKKNSVDVRAIAALVA